MSTAWEATVLGHINGLAVVYVRGALLTVTDRGQLKDGSQAMLLVLDGDDRPAMALELGRFAASIHPEGRERLAVIRDRIQTLAVPLMPGESLPTTLRLWLSTGLEAETDPKVFGVGERAPHVSPAETQLHYVLGLGQSESSP